MNTKESKLGNICDIGNIDLIFVYEMEPNTHETEIYDVGVEEGRARVTALSSGVKSATATATTGSQRKVFRS